MRTARPGWTCSGLGGGTGARYGRSRSRRARLGAEVGSTDCGGCRCVDVAVCQPALLANRTAPQFLLHTSVSSLDSRRAPIQILTSRRSSGRRPFTGQAAELHGAPQRVHDGDRRSRKPRPTQCHRHTWLATGGTGDVLTGMVAAYLSAGLTALDAASSAAFVHGIAGRLGADGAPCTSFDVLSAIPSAVRTLSESSPTRD